MIIKDCSLDPSAIIGLGKIKSYQWFAGRQQEILSSNRTLQNCYLYNHVTKAVSANHIFQCIIGVVKALRSGWLLPTVDIDLTCCM